MQNVQISFVVPIYNMEKYLTRCVESILNQTYKNFELILVDDGSTDRSNIICDELQKQDDRVTVIHKKNGGLSSARNAGIHMATGDYICFVDSDDWIEDSLLEEALLVLEEDDDVFVYGHRMVSKYGEKGQGEDIKACSLNGEEALEKFLENKINGYTWNKIVRRELLLNHNIFFPEGRNYEDVATTYKMLMYAHNVKYTEKVFYNYFINNTESITYKDTLKNLQDYYLACLEMYQDIKEYYRVHDDAKIKLLECLRINLYTQLYIRLSYYLCTHKNDENIEILRIKKKVKDILDTQYVSIKLFRKYKNFGKYILYKLKLLDVVILMQVRRARGYKL